MKYTCARLIILFLSGRYADGGRIIAGISGFLWSLLFILVSVLPVSAQQHVDREALPLERFSYSAPAMGVTANIVVYCQSRAKAEKAIGAAVRRIEKWNRIFSDYLDDSQVGRLQGLGGDGRVRVSPEFMGLLRQANTISEQTDGYFDVSIGALTKRWRAARKNSVLPERAQIDKDLENCGYQKIRLAPQPRKTLAERNTDDSDKVHWIEFPKGMRFDFGGIAKGNAADFALGDMRALGVNRAFVDLGGDIAVGDAPPGEVGWRIQIAAPDPIESGTKRYIQVANCGIATSGDTEQYVEIDGARYSHILNPKTGLGVQRHANVTVVAESATLADAFASAFIVMQWPTTRDLVAELSQRGRPLKVLVQERTKANSDQLTEQATDDFPDIKLFDR